MTLLGTVSVTVTLVATLVYTVISYLHNGDSSIWAVYEQWRNALHIGLAYFVYQVTDDVPHLIAGRSPISTIDKDGKPEHKEMDRAQIPNYMLGRVTNHLSRTLFVVVVSQLILKLTNK